VALSEKVADTMVGSDGLEGLPVLPHQLERALASLTPEQREVVHLRFEQGLSAAEIGQIQERSAGAVRALQFRALETLRDTLAVTVGG
jgi:DNA-directed RNA polymerase specialized sigma24 family protein